MEIRNHPDLFALSAPEALELLESLDADPDDARDIIRRANEHAYARSPLGKYYVQVDHQNGKFIVSVHGKRTAVDNREIR